MHRLRTKHHLNLRVLPAALVVFSVASLLACQSGARGPAAPEPTASSSSILSPDVQAQLDQSKEANIQSAQNAISQARFAFGGIGVRLSTVNPIDLKAYNELQQKVQPPMLIAANSLGTGSGTTDSQSQINDFRQLFNEVLKEMFTGIDNNVQLYQGFFEAPQIVNASSGKSPQTNEALTALAQIFQATQIAQLYVAQLTQYTQLVPAEDAQKLADSIRDRQSVVINGVINFTAQGASASQTRQAYSTIVQGLTNPNLLNLLVNLATKVFGTQNVATRTDQLTPTQPNPNSIAVVIREGDTVYRLINVENGKLVNRVSNDTRGLSAADLLNQTNVVGFTNNAGNPK